MIIDFQSSYLRWAFHDLRPLIVTLLIVPLWYKLTMWKVNLRLSKKGEIDEAFSTVSAEWTDLLWHERNCCDDTLKWCKVSMFQRALYQSKWSTMMFHETCPNIVTKSRNSITRTHIKSGSSPSSPPGILQDDLISLTGNEFNSSSPPPPYRRRDTWYSTYSYTEKFVVLRVDSVVHP